MHLFNNLATLLEKSAFKRPFKIAVEDVSGNKLTYQNLNDTSDKLKVLLTENNIGAGNRVGLLVAKSIDAISYIFAILKSNAAYVSLDYNAPVSRNNFICNDCELQALFIEKKLMPGFIKDSCFDRSYTETSIDEIYSILIFNQKKKIHSENLAYIIYTSGSTGTPKGVTHTHSTAFTFINWAEITFSIKLTDRFFSYAPLHFDLSIFDIFTCISAGATLVLANQKVVENPMLFAQELSNKEITVLYATPSALSYLASFGKMDKHSYKNLKPFFLPEKSFQ